MAEVLGKRKKTPNKSSSSKSSQTKKSKRRTPYERLRDDGYSLLIFRKILTESGPDEALDYLLKIVDTYINQHKNKELSIYDLIQFDAMGYGHTGSPIDDEPGGKVTTKSINYKAMPNCFVQTAPPNIIAVGPSMSAVYDFFKHQNAADYNLSRADKTKYRGRIGDAYWKCDPYYIEKVSKLDGAIKALERMRDTPTYDYRIADITSIIEYWFSDNGEGWEAGIHNLNTRGYTENELRNKIFIGAINFLKVKKREYEEQSKNCKEGAEFSKKDALKTFILDSDKDKKAIVEQARGFSSCDIVKANVLFEPKIQIDNSKLSKSVKIMLTEIRKVMSEELRPKTAISHTSLEVDDLLYTPDHNINESGFPVRFFRKLFKFGGFEFDLSSLYYTNNTSSNDELVVEAILSKLSPIRIHFYHQFCCYQYKKTGIKEHDSQSLGGGKKTRKRRQTKRLFV